MKTMLLFIILLNTIVMFSQNDEYETIWKGEEKEYYGKETLVIDNISQDCQVLKWFETREVDGIIVYYTMYGIGFNQKVTYYLIVEHGKSKGLIYVTLSENNPGIFSCGSGEIEVNTDDFTGLKYELKGIVNAISGGKKELELKFVSEKKEHVECLGIMNFCKDEMRLHYDLDN